MHPDNSHCFINADFVRSEEPLSGLVPKAQLWRWQLGPELQWSGVRQLQWESAPMPDAQALGPAVLYNFTAAAGLEAVGPAQQRLSAGEWPHRLAYVFAADEGLWYVLFHEEFDCANFPDVHWGGTVELRDGTLQVFPPPPPTHTWTRSVPLDAPGQRHGQWPVSGTANPPE